VAVAQYVAQPNKSAVKGLSGKLKFLFNRWRIILKNKEKYEA